MEIKATLNKPYTETERCDFIVEYNHKLGYEIQETAEALLAVHNEPLPPTKEEISAIRQQLYVSDADPLKYDYEECLARYGEGSQKTVDAKNAWLAKKDEIRESNPYPVE